MKLDSSYLGTREDKVEERLASVFGLASRWKAVALLDEADVFLERRSISDLKRNGLVSGQLAAHDAAHFPYITSYQPTLTIILFKSSSES